MRDDTSTVRERYVGTQRSLNTQQVVEELAHEIDIEAEVVALEVDKVLAYVPKSPRTSRSKPTPTKET